MKGGREAAGSSPFLKRAAGITFTYTPLGEPLVGEPLVHIVAQTVKTLPSVWETWVRSLGQEDALEKEIAIHSSILAWKTAWTEEPG